MPIKNEPPAAESLAQLIQPNQFIGWVYQVDYEQALVLTNDAWKAQAKGVPHNCFLLAISSGPEKAAADLLLLRVTGAVPLPLGDPVAQAKIESSKNRTPKWAGHQTSVTTQDEFQFGGLQCRVLGTFYMREGRLRLGSDLT